MTFLRLATIAGLFAATAAPAYAARVFVDFEDHPGHAVLLEDGYGGINWGGAFRTYDTAAAPFTLGSRKALGNVSSELGFRFDRQSCPSGTSSGSAVLNR